jgi:hypothetical protein
MGGIFLGFLCAVALIGALGRGRAGQPPSGRLGLACWALVVLTGLDGLNAFLADGNLPHLYVPSTAVRLLTGLAAGLGLGLMAVPVVAGVIWAKPRDEHSIEDSVELVGGLAVAGLLGALILAGVGVLLWPVALLMVLAVLVAFGVANVYVLVLGSGRAGQAEAPAELRGVLISSFGLVMLELGALAALRGWLIASFGFTWGI